VPRLGSALPTLADFVGREVIVAMVKQFVVECRTLAEKYGTRSAVAAFVPRPTRMFFVVVSP
jgi:hypothetical protein